MAPRDPAEDLWRLERRLLRERNSRLEAEAIAERGLRDLYEKQQQLQLLERVATEANQNSSITEVLQLAVTEICRYTGWPFGHVYLTELHEGAPRQIGRAPCRER